MKHLGDITKIDGNTVPIVDCVIGGSPCQDLSIAGLRAGLEGKRSGLFMEQIRIVKEIREHDRQRILNTVADDDVRPRYMVWENVRGALSSPGGDRAGEDFRCVLEEVARVSEESVTIPRPPKGKWPASGVIIGDTYSIAWRLFDAQWWGVRQRRSRICLVADFNGHTAADIVFSRGCQQHGSTKRIGGDTSVSDFGAESRSEVSSLGSCVPGNPESCRKTREGSEEESSDALRCADVCSVYCFDGDKLGKGERSGGSGCGIRDDGKCYCLTAKDVHSVAYTMQVRCGCEGGQGSADTRG